jgi:hypothetical protein
VRDTRAAKQYLNKINTASDRLKILWIACLNYALPGVLKVNFQQIPLREIIKTIESDLEILIEEKKL